MGGKLKQMATYLGLAEERYEDYQHDYEESYEDTAMTSALSVPQAAVTPLRTSVMPTASGDSLKRITTVHATAYEDALLIGEALRNGTPVIMDLENMDPAEAKRLVDFASGLIFGLHGGMEKVNHRVFLLSPQHVELTSFERETTARDAQPGLYDQG